MSGTVLTSYNDKLSGYHSAQFLCKFLPMPTVELMLGICMINFRQRVFVMQNVDQPESQVDLTESVGPFSE